MEAQIADYASLITQTEEELADAEKREEAQYELFCQRVRAMEESGEVSYWSVLFGASSFTDMLARLDDVNEVMEADQKVIDDLKTLQVEITEKKEQLEDSKAEREAAKADLVSKKSELDKQRQQAIAMVNAINDNEQENKETLAALGWERDVEDTSPREGADSFVDSDRFAPLRSYVFNQNTPFDTKPDYLKVTLCGALVEHVSVGCRGGIVHYVSYNFLSGYFADRDAYWAAAQTLRQGLGEALAETAEFVGERYDAEKLNAEEFKEPYIAHWVHGDYRLEMEVWTNFIVLRLRYFPYYD